MIGFVQILGGLALLLYGIRLLSSGMEKLTGGQIQRWLDHVTSNRFKSAGLGALATAMIQSSGLLMVTMIGLINANLMSVQQAIGVMLGQEIGTTLTAQVVAFDIGKFNLLFVVLGIVLLEFVENRDWKKYGEIAMGIGLIFTAMGFMSSALKSLLTIPWFAGGLEVIGRRPLVGVLAGLVVTSLTQSSTAVTSMTVAMGLSRAITIEGAVGIILGANIGSCVTGFVASLRLSRAARQASLAQIVINLLGVLLFLPFIRQYAGLIGLTSGQLARQVANAHTIFNLIVSLLCVPFVRQIAWLATRLAPEKAGLEKPKLTRYIDARQLSVPAVALSEAVREMTALGEAAAAMVADSCQALIGKDRAKAESVIAREDQFVDPVFKQMVEFVNQLLQGDHLTRKQSQRCFQIKNLLTDIERVADLSEDIAQLALERIRDDVPFTAQALGELREAGGKAQEIFALAIRAFAADDRELGRTACRMENEFDRLYWQFRQNHIDRLAAGACSPRADVIFTEAMRALERVSDHADNIGVSVSRSSPDGAS
ncbi:MAG TPA: Na/Pi cotransporter family protein [Candidatus Aminicenantes bacterium]|nr:Na/Pi cotransporter family protein [Candidatus Aminicenantes bacterium]